jgi:hypothetical protein
MVRREATPKPPPSAAEGAEAEIGMCKRSRARSSFFLAFPSTSWEHYNIYLGRSAAARSSPAMSDATPDDGQGALAGFAAQLPADGKVTVNFKHAGDAPILKKSTFKLPATTTLATVADQLRKQLQLTPEDPLVRAMRCQHIHSYNSISVTALLRAVKRWEAGRCCALMAPCLSAHCMSSPLPLPCSRSFCTAARPSRLLRMRDSAMSPSVSRWELLQCAPRCASGPTRLFDTIERRTDGSCHVLHTCRSEARSSCTTVRHQRGADRA